MFQGRELNLSQTPVKRTQEAPLPAATYATLLSIANATGFVPQGATATWGAPTGTVSRTALAAYAGQTVSNPPTQAEVQALDDAVKALSQHVVALITDLRTIGALKS